MDHPPSSAAAAALDIIRTWDWQSWDPDGVPIHTGKALNWVLNRLAMEGIRRPQDAILTLLCQGALNARGDYKWCKFQDFDQFRIEVHDDPIKPLHWQKLLASIQEGNRDSGLGSAIGTTLQLPELEIADCPAHKWEYGSCRFSYASVTDKIGLWNRDYMEEWFSAWDIDIWPQNLEPIIHKSEPEPETALPMATANKGGRPTAADWELAALEIAGRYYRGDIKPQSVADVGRELASWLGDQDLHPSDSTVHSHAKIIFNAIQSWEED